MKLLIRTLAILVFVALSAGPVLAADADSLADSWSPGSNWLTVRGGYAKSGAEGAGHGGLGYGFGFTHHFKPIKVHRWSFLRHFSLGGFVHNEVIGHLRGSAEIEVPVSLELVRHFHWGPAFRPYLGVGAGPVYRKLYRTGQDTRVISGGGYLTFGGNVPVADRHLLGLDLRLLRSDASNIPPNPVFGAGSAEVLTDIFGTEYSKRSGNHWSVKVGYSLVY